MRAGVVTGALLLFASLQAAAAELKYTWRKDAVTRYRYEETVHWKGGAILTVHALFAERVRALRADGRAVVEWTLEALSVSDGAQSFDLREQVRADERIVVVADAKGHFAFPKIWRVGLRDGRPAVQLASVKSPQMIDVVPHRLLSLLALPQGSLERGHTTVVRHGSQTLQWRLATVEGTAATLYVADAAAPRASHAVSQPAKPEATDLVVRFDVAEGQLLEVRGTLIWTESTRAISRVLLQRLPEAPDYSSLRPSRPAE